MGIIKNFAAGLAGAVALNIIHESLKKKGADMPRVDLLGEEALNDILGVFGNTITDQNTLYKATLAGDILSNAIYYSAIGVGKQNYIWPRAIVSGLAAGLGAVKLAKPLGLNERTVARTEKTKGLTVAYYVTGALVTAFVLKSLTKK
ncbi:hypothetical protein [Pedobacter endophyticus]|uniref:Uncharacterized protein n=1 Tax=Pedobacter endophyticus TaxID=2789740 RepID=A0A7S9KY73_9SPHI|nr:hypothetical protein [Pedobacter endophyticus]QPH39017.1 hypothetical protein IZT61_18435 [Pedobacter endophyticus]